MELRDGEPVYYIFAGGTRVASLQDDNSGTGTLEITYLHQDHLGGTALATDSDGLVVQLYDYYPFGTQLEDASYGDSPVEVNHSFTDKEFEEELGLYYFEARWMDSRIGQFVNVDPMDGISYIYAAGNPIRMIDPTGLYNVDTGEIEDGDTSDSITTQVNDAYGIETTWENIAEVSFFEDNYGTTDPTELVGHYTLVGTESVADVTYYLNDMNDARVAEASANDYSIWDLASLFCSNCSWDLKNSDDPIFGTENPYTSYIYFGDFIRYDSPGNIQYGNVMSGQGYSWFTTSFGAQYASWTSNGTLDDPYDQKMINWGYDMFLRE